MAAPIIYIVSDMRTVPDGDSYAVITTTTQHRTRMGAEERYHTALATAARSDQWPRWSAVLMTNEGLLINSASYDHEQPEPEPEPEPEGEE